MKIPEPSEQPARKRIKRPRLAEDGLPAEMFQDVKRACHRYLMTGKGTECNAYRMERRAIELREIQAEQRRADRTAGEQGPA